METRKGGGSDPAAFFVAPPSRSAQPTGAVSDPLAPFGQATSEPKALPRSRRPGLDPGSRFFRSGDDWIAAVAKGSGAPDQVRGDGGLWQLTSLGSTEAALPDTTTLRTLIEPLVRSAMCQMITLIVPTNDEDTVRSVMDRHDRSAVPVNNSSVARILEREERQFFTMRHSCDCGTALGRSSVAQTPVDEVLAEHVEKLRTRGWSKSKIGRAITDKLKAAEKQKRAGPDSLELWQSVVEDLFTTMKLPHVGLLVHDYRGDAGNEAFEVARREVRGGTLEESLARMNSDEVVILRNV